MNLNYMFQQFTIKIPLKNYNQQYSRTLIYKIITQSFNKNLFRWSYILIN